MDVIDLTNEDKPKLREIAERLTNRGYYYKAIQVLEYAYNAGKYDTAPYHIGNNYLRMGDVASAREWYQKRGEGGKCKDKLRMLDNNLKEMINPDNYGGTPEESSTLSSTERPPKLTGGEETRFELPKDLEIITPTSKE